MRAAALSVLLLVARAAAESEDPIDPQVRAALPDLTGTWAVAGADAAVPGSVLSLYRRQPTASAAAAPNAVYAVTEADGNPRGHCWLTPIHDFGSRRLARIDLACDGGTSGFAAADGGALSLNGTAWARRSATPAAHNATIHTVHMIYMNHYDVGYTGYVNDVDNKYMHDYFPLAASTAKAMKANTSDGGDRFIYTTHAWLMQRFLECPCPQPPPTPPCVAGLPGVWTSADGRARFYFSDVRHGVSVNCLTTDWEATPAGNCTWGSGKCTLSGSDVSCELDDGKTIAGAVSAGGDTITFAGGADSWHKFTGPLSGLWYGTKRVVNGPNDPEQYLVIGHNASDGNVSVWWDTGM